MIRNFLNAAFATAKVKSIALRHDVADAKTFVETRMPNGVLRRHQLDLTVRKFLNPSEGLEQVVVWKALQAMLKSNSSLGELAYVCYNGNVFAVDSAR